MSMLSMLGSDIITFHILPHLDGKTLIILSSVSSQFHNLIWKINNNSNLWRNICISTWPSLLANFTKKDFLSSVISVLPGGYRTFFLDAFPSIHPPLNNPLPSPLPPMAGFYYTVDIFLHGEQQPLYSLHGPQIVFTSEYYSHPSLDPPIFKFELCHAEAMVNFIKVKKEECLEYLKQKLTFSCVAIDPKGIKRAVSLFTSGCKAVSAERTILGVMVVFETALPVPTGLTNLYTEMIKCRIEVTCRWEGNGEDKLRVGLVSLTMKDINGKSLLERDGAAVILNAIQNGARRGRNTLLTQLV